MPAHKIFMGSWPLFFGLALMMLGNGLQGTLMGVRADIEGFSTFSIGLVMSFYYLGHLAGSYLAPHLVSRVGHIRVFAAMASLASTTVLLHAVFGHAWTWMAIRVFTGFAFAALFIVVESWLNSSSNAQNRGKILAIYMFTLYGGMGLGQFLLNLAPPEGFELFVLTSVLVSLALIPISLSSRPAPHIEVPKRVSMIYLYKSSPLGFVGVFVAGMTGATLIGFGPVYASEIGLGYGQLSSFMAALIFGAMLFQMPVGTLSDRFDRRKILIALAAISTVVGFSALVAGRLDAYTLMAFGFVFSGISIPLYSVCIAHTNDHLEQDEIISASASLILLSGVGAAMGPMIASSMMQQFGPGAFFGYLGTMFGLFTLFGIYRMSRRESVAMEDQGHYMTILPRASTPAIAGMAEDVWSENNEDFIEGKSERVMDQDDIPEEEDHGEESGKDYGDEKDESSASSRY